MKNTNTRTLPLNAACIIYRYFMYFTFDSSRGLASGFSSG